MANPIDIVRNLLRGPRSVEDLLAQLALPMTAKEVKSRMDGDWKQTRGRWRLVARQLIACPDKHETLREIEARIVDRCAKLTPEPSVADMAKILRARPFNTAAAIAACVEANRCGGRALRRRDHVANLAACAAGYAAVACLRAEDSAIFAKAAADAVGARSAKLSAKLAARLAAKAAGFAEDSAKLASHTARMASRDTFAARAAAWDSLWVDCMELWLPQAKLESERLSAGYDALIDDIFSIPAALDNGSSHKKTPQQRPQDQTLPPVEPPRTHSVASVEDCESRSGGGADVTKMAERGSEMLEGESRGTPPMFRFRNPSIGATLLYIGITVAIGILMVLISPVSLTGKRIVLELGWSKSTEVVLLAGYTAVFLPLSVFRRTQVLAGHGLALLSWCLCILNLVWNGLIVYAFWGSLGAAALLLGALIVSAVLARSKWVIFFIYLVWSQIIGRMRGRPALVAVFIVGTPMGLISAPGVLIACMAQGFWLVTGQLLLLLAATVCSVLFSGYLRGV